ncbi:MAG: ProQ/FinO family protein [Pseudomonadota bacterium]
MSETTPLPTPDTAPDAAPPAAPEAASPTAPAVAPMSPAACAQQLKQLFPALFGGAVKPFKLRIQIDIQERAPGTFSKQTLSAFFRRHTGATSYLIAMTKAPHRFDLDGQAAGEITDEHRKVALDELARRRGNQEERRQLEEQQRRNRAGLLHDFQTTTLTKANFCALKGVPVDELDGLLEIARGEAEERARQAPPPRHAPAFDRPRRSGPDGDRSGRGGRSRG